MSHYQQSLVLEATPATVYTALTGPKGLRGWWMQDCNIETQVGGTIHFRFERKQGAHQGAGGGPRSATALRECAHRGRPTHAPGRIGGHAARLPSGAGGRRAHAWVASTSVSCLTSNAMGYAVMAGGTFCAACINSPGPATARPTHWNQQLLRTETGHKEG